jgi:hypothetical protein
LVNKLKYDSKRAGVIVGLFFLSLLPSCGTDEKIVATVDDHELTESDARILMEHLGYDYSNKSDRAQFLNNWCELEAMRIELEKKEPEFSVIARLKADMYMGELSRYYCIDELVRKQTDTSITSAQINTYYQTHLSEFKYTYTGCESHKGYNYIGKGIHSNFIHINALDGKEGHHT